MKVFVALFCTPKSSMENPSLRMKGHVSSMNGTLIVEDDAEDEFGQWAKDEVTMGRHSVCLLGRPFEGRQVKRRKGKVKEKAEDDPKGPEEHSLVMSKRKIPNGGKKRTKFGGQKERKARRVCQKAMMASMRVVFALTSPTKEHARIIPRTKEREGPKRKRQGRNLSSIRILSLRNTQ